MTDNECYEILEHSKLQMGTNYLIDPETKTVHEVMCWAQGGIAYRKSTRMGDKNWWKTYQWAATDEQTLFVVAGQGEAEKEGRT